MTTICTPADYAVKADLYLRLSDFRRDDADSFPARERALRVKAKDLGWQVVRVIIENDVYPPDHPQAGRRKPASAYKRQRVVGRDGRPVMRNGRPEYRVLRDGWQSMLTDLGTGAVTAVLAEDLDRAARDPRDVEDLIDAIAGCHGHARSLSGSLMLTNGGTSDQIAMARVMVTMAAKASADTSRRVADGRERTAGAGSYGGGRRPFGFRADPDAPKYGKKLIIVPDEAKVIRNAATALLASEDPASLRFLARELREARVPTVTGVPWSAVLLRDVLRKPAVAGILVHTRTGTQTPGAWPGILTVDEWEQICAKLDDPARRTNAGRANAPRWLGSGLYLCGRCCDGTSVQVNGGKQRSQPAYVCQAHTHLRRAAAPTDELVGRWIVERLSESDAADLLRPPDRPDVDTAALRREQKKLETAGARQAAMHALGDITDDELRAGSRARQQRLQQIATHLSASACIDPLAEFRGAPAQVVWDSLPLTRKRDVTRLLATVTLLPVAQRGRGFASDSVRLEPVTP